VPNDEHRDLWKADLGSGPIFMSTKNPAAGSFGDPPPGSIRLAGSETQVQAV